MSDDAPEDDIGPSGFDDDRPLTRSDLGLMAQALRADWPIGPTSRQWIIRKVGQILETNEKPRHQMAAAKLLLAATSLNIKQGALDLARAKFEAERDTTDGPTAVDVVKEMQEAAKRYEREHPGDRGGTDAVQGGPEPVQ